MNQQDQYLLVNTLTQSGAIRPEIVRNVVEVIPDRWVWRIAVQTTRENRISLPEYWLYPDHRIIDIPLDMIVYLGFERYRAGLHEDTIYVSRISLFF